MFTTEMANTWRNDWKIVKMPRAIFIILVPFSAPMLSDCCHMRHDRRKDQWKWNRRQKGRKWPTNCGNFESHYYTKIWIDEGIMVNGNQPQRRNRRYSQLKMINWELELANKRRMFLSLKIFLYPLDIFDFYAQL